MNQHFIHIIREKLFHFKYEVSSDLFNNITQTLSNVHDEKVTSENEFDKTVACKLEEYSPVVSSTLFDQIIDKTEASKNLFAQELYTFEYPISTDIWKNLSNKLDILEMENADISVKEKIYDVEFELQDRTKQNIFAQLDKVNTESFDSIAHTKLTKYEHQTTTEILNKTQAVAKQKRMQKWIARVAAVLVLFVGVQFVRTNLQNKADELNSYAIQQVKSNFSKIYNQSISDSIHQFVANNSKSNSVNNAIVQSTNPQATTSKSTLLSANNYSTSTISKNNIFTDLKIAENLLSYTSNAEDISTLSKTTISHIDNEISLIPKQLITPYATFDASLPITNISLNNSDLSPALIEHYGKNKFALGITAQVHFNQIDNKQIKQIITSINTPKYTSDLGYSIGLVARYDVNKRMAIESGIDYVNLGQKYFEANNQTPIITNLNANYMQIPFILKIKNQHRNNAIELSAGAHYGLLQSHKILQNKSENIDIKNQLIHQEFGLRFGANYLASILPNTRLMLGVNASFSKPTTELFNQNSTTNSAIGFKVGFLYFLK